MNENIIFVHMIHTSVVRNIKTGRIYITSQYFFLSGILFAMRASDGSKMDQHRKFRGMTIELKRIDKTGRKRTTKSASEMKDTE